MDIREQVGNVRRLSDEDLLASLGSALGSSRQLMAVVIAHLGEVEERRLALRAGFESMFAYCTRRLGMSEDEACRRIEVARLARRFPVLFEHLADGRVSLSVAALLKVHLDEANHASLLAAVSGKTVTRAREVLAAWFPRPDVAATIRKLPTRRGDGERSQGASAGGSNPLFELTGARRASDAAPALQASAANTSTREVSAHPPPEPAPERPRAAPPRPTQRKRLTIEPLSPERYRIELTADAELKRKLDLARDLLRHAVPHGDLGTIVGRALDLLIEETMKRRFGQTKRSKSARPSRGQHREPSGATSSYAPDPTSKTATVATPTKPATTAATTLAAAAAPITAAPITAAPTTAAPTTAAPTTAAPTTAAPTTAAPTTAAPTTAAPTTAPPTTIAATRLAAAATPAGARPLTPIAAATPTPRDARRLPNETRRVVLERDGLRCSWQGPDGTRCNSRAWLEHDHAIPRALGGGDDPENIRHYCRPHNRLAAEQAYGQPMITRIIAGRRARRAAGGTPPRTEPYLSETRVDYTPARLDSSAGLVAEGGVVLPATYREAPRDADGLAV